MSSTRPTPEQLEIELPTILTRHDRARFVKEARRRRAEESAKLFRALGRGLARLGRGLAAPPAACRPIQRSGEQA